MSPGIGLRVPLLLKNIQRLVELDLPDFNSQHRQHFLSMFVRFHLRPYLFDALVPVKTRIALPAGALDPSADSLSPPERGEGWGEGI